MADRECYIPLPKGKRIKVHLTQPRTDRETLTVNVTQPDEGKPMCIVICGPQGGGKTRHAEALRAHFGCQTVADLDESMPMRMVGGMLLLTNMTVPEVIERLPVLPRRVMTFDVAMREAGLSLS